VHNIDTAIKAVGPPLQDGWPLDRTDCIPAEQGEQFESCSQLFSAYPLAVISRCTAGLFRSMVLMKRTPGAATFFALSQDLDGLFTIRPLRTQNGAPHEIRAGGRVPDEIHEVLAHGVPVPHNSALLGWVIDRQVTALLAVRTRLSALWDVPEIRVLPMSDTHELDWPPFSANPLLGANPLHSANPLRDGQLWDYLECGQLVDLAPLLAQHHGNVFWIPTSNRRMAYVVITGNLSTDDYWLPAGVYVDHWQLREGIPAPSARQLLAVPGAVDLASTTY
jgi:hypothetical protein